MPNRRPNRHPQWICTTNPCEIELVHFEINLCALPAPRSTATPKTP
jgi:hypothetical protein